MSEQAPEPERITLGALKILTGCAEEWLEHLIEERRISSDNRLIIDEAISKANDIIKRLEHKP